MEKHKLVKKEEETLKFWQEKKIFEKSVEKESPKGDYVFYDGPPFATGTPHYGHIVASLMKDSVPRFFTMKGYRVERRWGWDCHGLPIENIVEAELKVKNKRQINEEIGIERFNEACRSQVLRYANEWKKFIPRMGRWVDMEHPYSTMDLSFMESVWWVFKQLWNKKLIYEGHKSMHICPRCETTLSQSEVSQGYKDIKDISVVAIFRLIDEKNTAVLAWTTTPWTLVGNVALAVGSDITYIKIKINNNFYILAKDTAEKILAGKKYAVIEKFKGKKLVGRSYEPLFPYFDNKENRKNGFKIYSADFVSVEEGSGVVHIAPAFGADDLALGNKQDLPWVQHVDTSGRFTLEVKDFAGQAVKPASDLQASDVKILKWLASHNKLFSKEQYTHSYPHCWRCDSPLLNYSTTSWFVNVAKIRTRMMDLARDINWVPEHIKDGRFGKWLEGAQDWSISRQRFWGSVLPIWKCNKCKQFHVFGSIAELTKRTGVKVDDLHKDKMDKIKFECSKCGGLMERIPDVLDCWFESGSMPYAQMHYPFENKEKFEQNFPAQFIAEGVDQTRCWFYYLLVLATSVADKIAFKNVIANGIVLAEDGQKMSKRLKNYPDPTEVINRYGADALRYYLLSSPVMKADTLLFSAKGVNEVFKKLMIILDNTFTFYKMYAIPDIKAEAKSQNILDKWIIAKLHQLLKEVTTQMEAYDLVSATRPILDFVNELSTWYLRRSRSRFKSSKKQDKKAVLATMKYVFSTLSKILAPFTPFIAEYIYQDVDRSSESVHLEAWPEYSDKLIDQKILDSMVKVREVVEQGLALREEAKIKVRQPLNKFFIPDLKLSEEFTDLIKEEVNVKQVIIGEKYKLDTKLTSDLQEEGLVREITRAINALRKKKGLTISDQVKVQYQTENSEIKKIISKYQKEIEKNTITFGWQEKEGQDEIKINGEKVLVTLIKQ